MNLIIRLTACLSLLMLAISCGTIYKGRNGANIVPVDSIPRGAQVFNEDGQKIGETPFFYRVDPSWSQDIKFVGDKGIESTEEYGCDLNWSTSIIPSALPMALFPVGTVVGGGMLITDIISGGVYNCDDELVVRVGPGRFEDKTPKHILVMPMYLSNEKFADRIVEHWKKSLFDKFKADGDKVIYSTDVIKKLAFNGISNKKRIDITKIKRKILNAIGHDYRVNHALILEVKDDQDGKLRITPRLYDLISMESVPAKYIKDFHVQRTDKESSAFVKVVSELFSFFPNSVTLSYYDTPNDDLYKDDNVLRETNKHPDAFPRLITSLGLDSVNHPMFYSPWDIGFSLAPSLMSSAWQSKIARSDYVVNVQALGLFYNMTLSLFTPFFFTEIIWGAGPGYFSVSDNRAHEFSRVSEVFRVGVRVSHFINERSYIRLGIDGYNPASSTVDSEEYHLDGWSEFYVGVGYYFPEMKTIVRNLLPW